MEFGQQLFDAIRTKVNGKESKVNETNAFGRSPLQVACTINHPQTVAKLLNTPGIDVNFQLLNNGWTAVMFAAAYCSTDALKVMLKDSRVDLDVKDKRGKGLEELVGLNRNIVTDEIRKCQNMIKEAKRRRGSKGHRHDKKSKEKKGIEGTSTYKPQQYEPPPKQYEQKPKQFQISAPTYQPPPPQFQPSAPTYQLPPQQDQTSPLQHQPSAPPYVPSDLDKEEREQSMRSDQEKDHTEQDLDSGKDAFSNLEAARGTLECPICMEMMKPPTRIWMCPSSHLVCQPCRERLEEKQCPTCRVEKITLRAFMAENFATTLF